MKALSLEESIEKVKKINDNIEVMDIIKEKGKRMLVCKCLVDGYIWKTTMGNILKPQGCPKCSGNARLTLEEISDYIVKNKKNIELLESTYINSKSRLNLKCKICNSIWNTTITNLKRGTGCPICANNSRNNNRIMKFEDILITYKEYNDNILIMSNFENNKKIKVHDKINVICLACNHEWSISFNNIRKGRGCPECKRINNSGENNSNYNPNLTDEEREYGRNIIINGVSANSKWRESVFERDNYTCVLSGKKGHINAHHLNGYHWCKEERFDINNGVTLNIDLHNVFHLIYGNKNNTKEQFDEFKIRYDIGEFYIENCE